VKRLFLYTLLSLSLLAFKAQAVVTGEMIMIRSSEAFPEAMALLQESISQHGYTLSRVQRVDVGLSAKGYKTDKYRVVFFGKGKQIQSLSARYPQLVPYLPLKIAIYAEGENTILVTSNPSVFNDMFQLPELRPVFNQWHKDISSILKVVQNQN